MIYLHHLGIYGGRSMSVIPSVGPTNANTNTNTNTNTMQVATWQRRTSSQLKFRGRGWVYSVFGLTHAWPMRSILSLSRFIFENKISEYVERCKRCLLSLTCEKSLCENGPDVDLGASNRWGLDRAKLPILSGGRIFISGELQAAQMEHARVSTDQTIFSSQDLG